MKMREGKVGEVRKRGYRQKQKGNKGKGGRVKNRKELINREMEE